MTRNQTKRFMQNQVKTEVDMFLHQMKIESIKAKLNDPAYLERGVNAVGNKLALASSLIHTLKNS